MRYGLWRLAVVAPLYNWRKRRKVAVWLPLSDEQGASIPEMEARINRRLDALLAARTQEA